MAEFLGGLLLPDQPFIGGNPTLVSSGTVSAVGHGIAFTFKSSRSGTLSTIGALAASSFVGTATFRVSIQGLGGDGLPDGVISVFREFTQPANGWFETGLMTDDGTDTGVPLDVVAGDTLCVVFDYSAHTSGFFTISNFNDTSTLNFPYMATKVSTWTKNTIAVPNVAVKFDDDLWMVPRHCVAITGALRANVLTEASSPNEVGALIIPPWDCIADGAFIHMRSDVKALIQLSEEAGGLLASTRHARACTGLVAGAPGDQTLPSLGGVWYWVSFEQAEMAAGGHYVLSIQPYPGSGGTVTVYDLPFDSSDVLLGMQGGPTGRRSERAGGSGAFTTDADRKVPLCVHLSDID